MNVTNETWTVNDFVDHAARIEAQPVYQRGAVWNDGKQRLLIDSLLRKLDVPKLYLHALPGNAMYDYQIIDGQQRLNSIWAFASGQLTLHLEDDYVDAPWYDKTYAQLAQQDRRRFSAFELIVAVVRDASDDDVRELFARLQMGDRLNPAELRNSIRSAVGTEIRNMAENHRFFRNCHFPESRYKHHDLAAHTFALCISGHQRDLKAPDLRQMYIDHADTVSATLPRRVAKILNTLDELQKKCPGWLDRKWSYVDLCLLLAQTPPTQLPPLKTLTDRYVAFEKKRRTHAGHPDVLLSGSKKDKPLYDYIRAFQLGGGIAENVKKRNGVLRSRLIH